MPRDNVALEKFLAINRTFLQNADIATLLDCSVAKASYYRKRFLKQYESEVDYFTPLIPTTDFIEFYKIDLDRIRDNYKVFHEVKGDLLNAEKL